MCGVCGGGGSVSPRWHGGRSIHMLARQCVAVVGQYSHGGTATDAPPSPTDTSWLHFCLIHCPLFHLCGTYGGHSGVAKDKRYHAEFS